MSVQNPERVVTKQDLADFYGQILPYLGGMPEILANKISKGDMYSTDEKMIGQWIDGKPLYQITISGSMSLTVNYTDYLGNLSGLNIDYGNVASYEMIDENGYGSALTHFDVWLRVPQGNIGVTNKSTQTKSGVMYVTLKYTKTTDSAVSIGNDTDYSTTEKIVGAWIDGRPIWQKSVQLNSSVSLTQDTFVTLFNLSDYSMDKLIGITLYNSSSFNNPLYNFITWLRDGHCDVRSCGITWNVGAFTIQYVKAT